MSPAIRTQRKTVAEICALVLFKKGRREVENQAPIRLGAVNNRTVYFPGRNKHNVSGLQMVGCAFDIIADTAVFKIQQFVKIVIMTLKITFFRTGQIENPKILGQIS